MEDKKNNNKLKKDTEKMENNSIKKSGVNNSIDKLNAINNFSNYISTLTSFQNILNNVLPNNYMNLMTESLVSYRNFMDSISLKKYTAIMSETLLLERNILKNSIPQNYMFNLLSEITNNITNTYYADTIRICMDEILNSNINLKDILMDSKLDINSANEVKDFDEKDKVETISNVKEIIDIAKEKNENTE